MKNLPDFKAKDEEREFWEKNSIADYWDNLLECEDRFHSKNLIKES